MAYEVFGNQRQCEIHQKNSLGTCYAIARVKIILRELNDDLAIDFHKNQQQKESKFMDKFVFIFSNNNYTNTSLLNDFHHIKYTHHTDDNDDAFSKIYQYFIGAIGRICNEKQCRFMTMVAGKIVAGKIVWPWIQ
eukprot:250181_1